MMSCMSFRVNPHSIICLNVKELLAWSRHHIWSLSDSNVIRTQNHLVRKRRLNHLAKLRLQTKWLWFEFMLSFMVFILWVEKFVNLTSVNVILIFDKKGGNIWNLSDCNEFWTKNDLTHKETLKYLTQLVKLLRVCLRVLICMMNRLCILIITYASLKEIYTSNWMDIK